MTGRLMFISNAIALAVFGAVFLVMPQFALDLFDVETYTATVFVARFLGGALLMAGVFVWLAKELANQGMERTLIIALLISSVVGFVLTLLGIVLAHVIRANGWVLLVIHILFVLAYGFLLSGVSVVAKNQEQYRQSP